MIRTLKARSIEVGFDEPSDSLFVNLCSDSESVVFTRCWDPEIVENTRGLEIHFDGAQRFVADNEITAIECTSTSIGVDIESAQSFPQLTRIDIELEAVPHSIRALLVLFAKQ